MPGDPRSTAKMHSELQALQRRLGRAERLAALGALAATLAHELGTPLHSIAGHLDLMRLDPSLTPPLRERTDIVSGEVDRLCGLIRRHLKRLRSPLPTSKPADLNAVASRILRVLEPTFHDRHVKTALEVDSEAGTAFACDARQIEQVLMNLIQNALDAMPSGGHLVVRTQVTPSGRAISVSDDGVGISPDKIGRVFEPFFTTKGVDHGTGLGLSLCREIARNHGGDIVLDSRPGEGTVVTLTLGRAPNEEPAE